ncbi:hypothetical protein ACP4OV_020662 [Aristida adscensionis]
MAGSFAGALLLLAVHLLAAVASARHAPAGSGSAPSVTGVLYNSPTNPGPSPSNGHGKNPSAGDGEAQHGALDGDDDGASGVVVGASMSSSETPATLSPAPCRRCLDHPPPPAVKDESARDAGQRNATAGDGDGEGEAASGVRP